MIRGVYTIEAAVITAIILILFQTMILQLFEQHDRVRAYAAAQRYLTQYGGESLSDAERKYLEAAFLEEAEKQLLMIHPDRVSFEKEGLRDTIRYTLGEEERSISARLRVRPLTLLRSAKGLEGKRS